MPDRTHPVDIAELERVTQLRAAQNRAVELFHQVELRGLIRPGILESQLNQEIYDLARDLFGITTYWHKRIVRAGANTLAPYDENPPDLTLQPDDILFLDLGPVFEEYEADFGRTFVLGSDPARLKLQSDIAQAFADGKAHFHATPGITAAQLFQHCVHLADHYGWEFGGPIAGHLIGHFPHERIPKDKISLYIHPDNPLPLRSLSPDGAPRHWILEIHFVDRARQIGGFYEELLTID